MKSHALTDAVWLAVVILLVLLIGWPHWLTAPPAPPKRGTWTEAQMRHLIRVGMTEDEIPKAFGEPVDEDVAMRPDGAGTDGSAFHSYLFLGKDCSVVVGLCCAPGNRVFRVSEVDWHQ